MGSIDRLCKAFAKVHALAHAVSRGETIPKLMRSATARVENIASMRDVSADDGVYSSGCAFGLIEKGSRNLCYGPSGVEEFQIGALNLTRDRMWQCSRVSSKWSLYDARRSGFCTSRTRKSWLAGEWGVDHTFHHTFHPAFRIHICALNRVSKSI